MLKLLPKNCFLVLYILLPNIIWTEISDLSIVLLTRQRTPVWLTQVHHLGQIWLAPTRTAFPSSCCMSLASPSAYVNSRDCRRGGPFGRPGEKERGRRGERAIQFWGDYLSPLLPPSHRVHMFSEMKLNDITSSCWWYGAYFGSYWHSYQFEIIVHPSFNLFEHIDRQNCSASSLIVETQMSKCAPPCESPLHWPFNTSFLSHPPLSDNPRKNEVREGRANICRPPFLHPRPSSFSCRGISAKVTSAPRVNGCEDCLELRSSLAIQKVIRRRDAHYFVWIGCVF